MTEPLDPGKHRLRRQLLRGGLGAPVLLTLPSGPAMATLGGGTGHTASAHCSLKVNVSATTTGYSCTGKGPYYWCAQSNFSWPSACKQTNYHQLTTTQSNCYKRYSSTWCSTKTHLQAQYGLCNTSKLTFTERTAAASQPNITKLAAYLSAAMLNYHSGRVSSNIAPLTQLQQIWDSFLTSGTWSPMPGYIWVYADLFDWLESTWIAM